MSFLLSGLCFDNVEWGMTTVSSQFFTKVPGQVGSIERETVIPGDQCLG